MTTRRIMAFHKRVLVIVFIFALVWPALVAQEARPAQVTPAQGAGGGGSIGSLSDGPISPGEIVHINVFDAPDFSFTTRVSESGDIPFPILGQVHIQGLN